MSAVSLRASLVRASEAPDTSQVLQRWRRQVAGRSELSERRGVHPFAFLGYRMRDAPLERLVPLERLSFVALYDDRDEDDHLVTRLVGVRARLVGDQLIIGSPDNTLFDKDLRLPPCSGNGRRLDPHDAELCETALCWEQHLQRVSRHPHYPRRNILRWPTWWCAVTESPPHLPTRCLRGVTLIPVEAAAVNGLPIGRVFADVVGVPKRQVLAGADPRRLLCGAHGLVRFDLYHSKFRRAT